MKKMNKNNQGFSLIELLIVILIISIIAAVAIPNMLAARRSANEGAAVSALRTLHSAQSLYQTSVGAGNYAGSISVNGDAVGLVSLLNARLIDDVLGSGVKNNYNFVGARTAQSDITPPTFFFSANPVSASGITQTGTKRFCITQQGFIGFDTLNLATAFDQNTTSLAAAFSN